MIKHSYEEVNEHIQWLIHFMQDDYPNDFELVINSFSAEIKSNMVTRTFVDDALGDKPESKTKSYLIVVLGVTLTPESIGAEVVLDCRSLGIIRGITQSIDSTRVEIEVNPGWYIPKLQTMANKGVIKAIEYMSDEDGDVLFLKKEENNNG